MGLFSPAFRFDSLCRPDSWARHSFRFMLKVLLSRGGIVFMRLLGQLPLPWVRALGWGLGWVLYLLAVSRRRVVQTNLRLCFPAWSPAQRERVAQQHFVVFAQAWLDRGWLWHGKAALLKQRLRLTGALEMFDADQPCLIFAPHFVGLDAGWTALTLQVSRHFATIYSHQTNAQVDAWVLAGRQRFGQPRLLDRSDGPKVLVSAIKSGQAFYLLPDMNYDPRDSIFVPFYGVPAATVTSLSRLARLGKARVIPVVTWLTPTGYEVRVLPAWNDVPSDDLARDTLTMNQRLEGWINTLPQQYYWVHKRFKDQPPGAAEIYQ